MFYCHILVPMDIEMSMGEVGVGCVCWGGSLLEWFDTVLHCTLSNTYTHSRYEQYNIHIKVHPSIKKQCTFR